MGTPEPTRRYVRRIFPNVKRGYDSGPPCAICGYFRINVRHEMDPEHSPEGIEYFRDNDLIGNLHDFVAEES